jgi:endonuclease/exonuclease/phosphatase family metal-dependent hydrolase
MDNVFNISGTAHEIALVHPDVVTLQEVDNMTQRHPIDEVAFLSQHAGFKYSVFAPWRPFEGGQYGIAILSRHPPLEIRKHGYVKPSENGLFYPHDDQKCLVQKPMDFCQGIVAIKIAPESFPEGIWIITTHISADGAQAEEARQLVEWVQNLLQTSEVKQALITGDFNEVPTGQGPSYLHKFFDDSFDLCYHNPSNPHGYTFNSVAPDRRIDYIWATGSQKVSKCLRTRTVKTQASDHLPFIGEWS